MRDALIGKTVWWKRTPLQLHHPTRTLMHGNKAFYLFADAAVAKEQWFIAFQRSCAAGTSSDAGLASQPDGTAAATPSQTAANRSAPGAERFSSNANGHADVVADGRQGGLAAGGQPPKDQELGAQVRHVQQMYTLYCDSMRDLYPELLQPSHSATSTLPETVNKQASATDGAASQSQHRTGRQASADGKPPQPPRRGLFSRFRRRAKDQEAEAPHKASAKGMQIFSKLVSNTASTTCCH